MCSSRVDQGVNMGLFSKILPIAEMVVGGVLLATGVGSAAGALLLVAAGAAGTLSQYAGGSVGSFLKSGVGQGLMAAVAIGGMAYSMYGGSALDTAQTAASQTGGASAQGVSSSVGQVASASGAAGGTDPLVATAAGMSADSGAPIAALADASTASANGTDLAALQSAQAGTTAGAQLNAGSAQMAMQQNTLSDASAVQSTGGGAVNTPGISPAMRAQAPIGSAEGASAPTGPAAANAAVQPGAAPPGGDVGPAGNLVEQGAQAPAGAGPTPPNALAPGQAYNMYGPQDAASSSGGGGMFSRMFAGGGAGGISPGAAAIQAGGSLVGGLGQGIMQKQSSQDQINAMQWANRTFYDPQQTSQLQAAAAAPVTVPQGYLQRAQAVKALMAGNAGIQQGSAGTPSTLPPGVAGQTANGGPVPVLGMNQTTRGGQVGG